MAVARDWRSRFDAVLKRGATYGPLAAQLAAVVGAVLFVLLTLLCGFVYEPMGVSPEEVGLSFGRLLVRTGVVWVWLLVQTIFAATVGAGLALSIGFAWPRAADVLAILAAVLTAVFTALSFAEVPDWAQGAATDAWTGVVWLASGTVSAIFVLILFPRKERQAIRAHTRAGKQTPERRAEEQGPAIAQPAGASARDFATLAEHERAGEPDTPSEVDEFLEDVRRDDGNADAETRAHAGDASDDAETVRGHAPEPTASGERRLRRIAIGFPIAIGVVTGLLMYAAARHDAKLMREGKAPVGFGSGASPPWNADIVRLVRTGEVAKIPDLPLCLLYLGRSDGISVFWEATKNHQRVLRIPSSAVIAEVLPHQDTSLESEKRPKSCNESDSESNRRRR